ncbi:hypothetical protein F511_20100 [Dorcoceras hygrometricum]|uniref:Uncharacterized protein n=1 Tax=Dorcoceras hygrometricum TaxID=472368 RepID=A0A2Z7CGM9_9LAMI|nr:hypothetical protein F511_20100 [Dorcoceras hygrometricum]
MSMWVNAPVACVWLFCARTRDWMTLMVSSGFVGGQLFELVPVVASVIYRKTWSSNSIPDSILRIFSSLSFSVFSNPRCEGERQYRTLVSLLGSLAAMRRVVNYHSSWARQQQVELFDASDLTFLVPSKMPPRRRDRGRGQFQEESEGQNEEVQRSVPRRGRDRQVDLEQTAAQPQGRGVQSRGRSQQFQQPRFGETPFRPFQQPGPSRFGPSSQPFFPRSQHAQDNAFAREQAEETPSRVDGGTCFVFDFA